MYYTVVHPLCLVEPSKEEVETVRKAIKEDYERAVSIQRLQKAIGGKVKPLKEEWK